MKLNIYIIYESTVVFRPIVHVKGSQFELFRKGFFLASSFFTKIVNTGSKYNGGIILTSLLLRSRQKSLSIDGKTRRRCHWQGFHLRFQTAQTLTNTNDAHRHRVIRNSNNDSTMIQYSLTGQFQQSLDPDALDG